MTELVTNYFYSKSALKAIQSFILLCLVEGNSKSGTTWSPDIVALLKESQDELVHRIK